MAQPLLCVCVCLPRGQTCPVSSQGSAEVFSFSLACYKGTKANNIINRVAYLLFNAGLANRHDVRSQNITKRVNNLEDVYSCRGTNEHLL